ncbi:hypothetical protein [Streptomyces clavuligerus]|uniref:hypothetical protein n=1 Tax=Streptomyces clavuligerus TaxID=1901 RepID=UPI001F07451B|nr:hypothetical protein [Streptomyces clavuligerus]
MSRSREHARAAALHAHFQKHPDRRPTLFFTDYGLALLSRFELARDEADFFDGHRSYDRSYTATHLVNWLTVALHDMDGRSARRSSAPAPRGASAGRSGGGRGGPAP